jgi:hypothetical protein
VVINFHPFFILLFFFPIVCSAEYAFTTKNEAAYNEFLNLRIEKGQSFINQALKEKSTNGISIYLANYSDVIKIFLTEDEKLYKLLSKNEELRINKIEALEKSSPYYRFAQAEIKLQWAFVKLKMGDELIAMIGLRSAYKLLEENIKLYPDFLPNKKTMGLLNVLIGSIPSNYNWVLSLIGMEGSIDKGMQQLNEVSGTDNPFRLEASIIKVIVENYITHAHKGKIEDAELLYNSHPENILICYLYSAILTKNSRGQEALEIINKRPVSTDIIYLPHVDLLLGELNLFKGEYISSRIHYNYFLSHFKGQNSLKDTYFKLFLTYWLNDEDELAMPYFDKILTNGKELYDSDKHAQRIAHNREIPNKTITKIRLYTDGGYYNKAFDLLKILSMGQFFTKRDKLEYLYRSARLYHKAGQINDAIVYYTKTIDLSKDETYYFAPNSALQLGYIYQSRNEKEEAKKQFTLALSYKNYEYKNSIDNKAKAALNELKD